MVALNAVEGLLGGIQDEVRWVVAKEPLTHVHDWLDGRGIGTLIDDCPGAASARLEVVVTWKSSSVAHQTSSLLPATLAAGFSFWVWAILVKWKLRD